MSYRRAPTERGREGGRQFVARIKRAYREVTGQELSDEQLRDPSTGRPAKIRLSERIAAELDALAEERKLPRGEHVGLRQRAPRKRPPPAPPLGPQPEAGPRSRFVVIPPPPAAIERPRRRFVVVRAPPPAPVRPSGSIVYEGYNGEVIYLERNAPAPPNPAMYTAIANVIDPGAEYVMDTRSFNTTGNEPNEFAPGAPYPLSVGQEPSYGAMTLEGIRGEDRWKRLDVLANRKKGSLTLGSSLTAERLFGIEEHWRTFPPPPYVVFRLVALRPVGPEGRAWLRMHEGKENCLVAAVRTKLKADKALTDKRAAILDEAAEKWKEAGADYAEVDWLSTKLKMHLPVYDAAGALLYEKKGKDGQPAYGPSSATGGGKKTVKLFRSDGHCSSGNPGFSDVERVEVYYPKESEQEEKKRAKDPDYHGTVYQAVALIKQKQLHRARIIGPEVLADDGTLYRPYHMDRAVHEWWAKEGGRYPQADDQDYKLGFDREGRQVDCPDIKSVGGTGGRKWRKWLDEHEFQTLWAGESREHWRASQLEAVAWACEAGVEGCEHYDMCRAYLACDAVMGVGPGRELVREFGFPAGGRQYYAKVSRIEETEKLVGSIKFRQFELAESAHPFVKAQLRKHFERSQWLPIPAAAWLNRSGLISRYDIDHVMYGVTRVHEIKFPTDRDLAVRHVGRCAYAEHLTEFFTRDAAEKDHFIRVHGGQSRALLDGFIVGYTDKDAKTNDFSYVRAFVLVSMFVNMADAVQRLGESVRRCSVDAIWVPTGTDLAAKGIPVHAAGPISWGQFRTKPAPKELHSCVVGTGEPVRFERKEVKEGLAPLPRFTTWATAFISPAGSGKTYDALRAFGGEIDRVVALAHNNAGAAALRDPSLNPHGIPSYTYHEWLYLGTKKASEWEPLRMGGKGFTKAVIWDEFAVAGAELLARVLPWMRRMGIVVILCGDPLGQLQEFKDPESGEKVVELLDELGVPVVRHETDWRARDCPALQRAKMAAWCGSYQAQVEALLSVAERATSRGMLRLWRPGDLIIEPTRSGSRFLADEVEKRRTRFPDEDVRYRFKPEDRKPYKKTKGVLPKVMAPNGEVVEAVIGSTVQARPGSAAEGWSPDTTTTVHSVQGATVKAPARIFVCLDKMDRNWCRNAVYVAMSRAERASQLVAVTDVTTDSED